MTNIVLSTKNIDDFINDVANEVVKKIELWNVKPPLQPHSAPEIPLTIKKSGHKKIIPKTEKEVING